jgi:glycogen operon protein
VRKYWRGDKESHRDFATRLSGSSDLYQWADRTPVHSINFITCHDGYTLRDLVSYTQKHNIANGEENRDGHNDAFSINFGVEGETDDPQVNELRLRMQKNYLATLFLSLGVPMLYGGDEFGRTQQGNNNAYCQDNEISWYNWDLIKMNQDLFNFCKGMIAFRRANPACRRNQFFNGAKIALKEDEVDLLWRNPRGAAVDWHSKETALACRINGRVNAGYSLYYMFNNTDSTKTFILPEGIWQLRIDTAQPTPRDHFIDPDLAPVSREAMVLIPKSLLVMSHKTFLFQENS